MEKVVQLKSIEKKIKYYELLMVRDLRNVKEIELPNNYHYVFWNDDSCKQDWINIHLETGEFNSVEKEAEPIFNTFYSSFYSELKNRCLFIADNSGEKVATATISPADEFGYKCVIDWFAISPKAQGKKLSRPLLSKVLLTAKGLGYKKILLHTQTNTWLAAHIYLTEGFKPFKTKGNNGWNILKTITNNNRLKRFKALPESEIFDGLMIQIENELNKKHNNYNYSVWYIDNRNDVFVRENNTYYEYKFKVINDSIELIKQ